MIRHAGLVEYELTRKSVKNINLRIRPDGTTAVSAPKRVPLKEIDRFVESRTDWIMAARERVTAQNKAYPNASLHTDAECLAVFSAVSAKIYPLFAEVLPAPPVLCVKQMKSRWGVCHPAKCKITLNKLLLNRPMEAIEYVVLHEYVHFLHPDHQKGFHAEMARLMPDYKARRKLLR